MCASRRKDAFLRLFPSQLFDGAAKILTVDFTAVPLLAERTTTRQGDHASGLGHTETPGTSTHWPGGREAGCARVAARALFCSDLQSRAHQVTATSSPSANYKY